MTKSVLIVDDSKLIRNIILKHITAAGEYRVRTAENGQEALDLYAEEKADIVFLDLHMPILDGYGFLEGVADNLNETAIIICTADMQKETVNKVNRMGVIGVMHKPPRGDEVKSALQDAERILQHNADKQDNSIELTETQLDCLQEIMNIAFGKAAHELSQVVDIYIDMSVPNIQIIRAKELPSYLRKTVKDYENINVIEQKYWGKFQGDALLVLPADAGKKLITLFDISVDDTFLSDPIEVLERESLMEMGNILVGACIGKIAELLKDKVSYSPPRVVDEEKPIEHITQENHSSDDPVIIMETLFHFNNQDVSGFLFLVSESESLSWLRSAIDNFIKEFL